jgi:hypothetical protein
MTRTQAFSLVFFFGAPLVAAGFAACNADVDSGCLAGPCADEDSGVPAADAGQSSCTGAEDGGKACYADYHLAAACDPEKLPTTGDIPCDVWAVMHKNPLNKGGCHKCHQNPPLNGAPFPETSYEDLLVRSSTYGYGDGGTERIFQSMAYALADNLSCGPPGYTPMPFATSEPLSCEDSLTLSNWLAGCAKPVPVGEGSGNCCKKLGMPSDPDAGCP